MQSKAKLVLEILFGTFSQPYGDFFKRWWVEIFSHVEGEVEFLRAHKHLYTFLEIIDRQVGCGGEQSFALVKQCFTFFLNDSAELGIVCCKRKVLEFFSFG